MKQNVLKINNLCASIGGKEVIKNLNLTINAGEIHTIMGPNGAGKSTLAKIIMGDSNYLVTGGEIFYNDVNVLELTVDKRANLGIFLGVQLPLEIEGVTNADFMRTALHTKDGDEFKLYPFIKKMDSTCEKLHMNKEMIHRSINKGFSGGERKKNEILQMFLLNPSFVMLDEIDSGLDVDSLKIVGENIMNYYNEEKPGMLLITHYQRLLDYVKPTHVHIMIDGTIVLSGDASLVNVIEEKGYTTINDKKKLSIGTCAIREKLKDE